jgi:hypothetical protein
MPDARIYLCSYWPLCKTAGGRQAVVKYGLPSYVNGLSRREPDFEHRVPAITASSRGRNFAPRLRPGDTVVYTTTKGRWGEVRFPHWRLVAVLEVAERFETHTAAAAWYRREGMPLPSNCVVNGNPPLPVPLTLHHGKLHDDAWDRVCIERAEAAGTLLACVPRVLDLHDPAVITQEDLLAIFGTVPNTRTPPEISDVALDRLLDLAERPRRRAA